MSTDLAQLEARLARVEREVEELKSAPVRPPTNGSSTQEPWWRQIAGVFANDEVFDEVVRLGAEWRRQQREP